MEISPSPVFCLCLIFVLGGQILVLYYQSIYGSRFFVPSRFLAPKFNYLMNIPDHDVESGNFEQLVEALHIFSNSFIIIG